MGFHKRQECERKLRRREATEQKIEAREQDTQEEHQGNSFPHNETRENNQTRGIIALQSVISNTPIVLEAEQLELFAKLVASTIIDVAKRFIKPWAGTREELSAKIYRDVLNQLIRKPNSLPDAVKPFFAKIGGVK